MKKLTTIALALMYSLSLTACGKNEYVSNGNGGEIPKYNSSKANTFAVETGKEICYEGVIYVFFSGGNSTWGGAKFDQNSQVIKCNIETKIIELKNK